MRTIVVYESMYGNTREVAEAIGSGIGDAEVLSVQEAVGRVGDPDLLVVGGPTHVHGLSSKRSRTVAAVDKADGEVPAAASSEPGLREWLGDLHGNRTTHAAAFDTRAHGSPVITGAASHGIARRLRHHGYDVLASESFIVHETEGPLAEGELERARAWGAELARMQTTSAARS